MNKKRFKAILPYFFVFLCLIVSIAISRPSEKTEPIVYDSLTNEECLYIGEEATLCKGVDAVVIVTVTNVKERYFTPEQLNLYRSTAETISTVAVEEVLMQNDSTLTYRKGMRLYVRETGTTRVIHCGTYRKADFLKKGDRMVLFLENIDHTRSTYPAIYAHGLVDYTIMRRYYGRSDRMIDQQGNLSDVPISPYGRELPDNQPFTQYKTLPELREALKRLVPD